MHTPWCMLTKCRLIYHRRCSSNSTQDVLCSHIVVFLYGVRQTVYVLQCSTYENCTTSNVRRTVTIRRILHITNCTTYGHCKTYIVHRIVYHVRCVNVVHSSNTSSVRAVRTVYVVHYIICVHGTRLPL